ncbi:hypothetical protein CRI70_23660 [Streptomyces sp. Ru87]|uniref:Lipoprotein n=2 Tax=Streptomyces TaxID=1883 RepID=A0ABQ7F999_9ACTN|nr:hypothetical protein GCU69_29795 [Streptomyces lycii]PGH48333.1 hypothetical protein CRI70_23660 [Streptomyces sp. Ru87]
MGVVTSGGEETGNDTTATSPAGRDGEPAGDKAADGRANEKKADAEAEPEAAKDEPAEKSQAEQFKDFVTKNGTPQEKEAARHVTKVQGADEQNDFLDSAEVYTDYTGGLMGPHQADGKLLASAFADWKDSENGLVTIYDADGEILSNGNF